MPTYQYACTSPACGLEFERVQAFTDAAITDCPDCSGRVRKVYGSVGVVFKGSGFYRTDSRDTKSADSKTTDSSKASSSDSSTKTIDSAKSGSSGSSSSDAKPVAAAAS
jgi:putative FmdB family regulatory protein